MTKILITGASGQLGRELCKLLDENNIKYNAPNSTVLDITNKEQIEKYFEQTKPRFVFHCAAYTDVDSAESDGKDKNWVVNASGTEYIAIASELIGAKLVYISTDYVFDGRSLTDYTIDAQVNPQNEYGRAKLAGEKNVQKYCSKYYIVRTSWVYGEFGGNFVYTMKKLATNHKKLTVVSDQFGRPTWTRTLAEFLLHIYREDPDFGVYHLSNDGFCSWYEFAKEILKDENIEIQPVTSEEYPQKAYRPRYSIMDLKSTKKTNFEILHWKDALELFIDQTE